MSKMLRRSTRREIFSTFGRFFAIFAIIAIGVGFFSGLSIAKDSMRDDGNNYLNEHNMFDFRIIAPLGVNPDEIEKIAASEGVNFAEGGFIEDALGTIDGSDEQVFRIHSITANINKLSLKYGRMPQSANECVIDARYFSESYLGKTVVIADSNSEETLDRFSERTLTVVGIATSPVYLNYERGNTSLGNGGISSFIYILSDSFVSEDGLFDEIYVDYNIPGAIYSDEYNDALDIAESKMENAVTAVLSERLDSELEESRLEIEKNEKELNEKAEEFEKTKTDTEKLLSDTKKELDDRKASLDEAYDGIDEKITTLTETVNSLSSAITAIEAQLPLVTDEALKQELDYNLTKYRYQLDEVQTNLTALTALNDSKEETLKALEDGFAEYEKALKEAEEEFTKAEKEIEDARLEISDAYAKLDTEVDWGSLTMTRLHNTGYVCFENDTEIVDAIAKVFPIFFFAVAALVCMTTMARMIDEQRVQIGTLIALGNKKREIRSKYLVYSGTASVLGCLSGFALGTYFLPKVIRMVYTMMYDFSDTVPYVFYPITLIISLIATLICSLGVTIFSLKRPFKTVPAQLMRPDAPQNGGRIFLERMGRFWDNMPFMKKVTARNIFRYKKRMLMMIIGISGCTALLVTGFGLRDSIYNVLDYQYSGVTVYDSSAILSENFSDDETFREEFGEALENIESYLPTMQFSAGVDSGDVTKSASVLIPYGGSFEGFFKFHEGEREIAFPSEGEAIINISLADAIGAEIGDLITVTDSDYKTYKFKLYDVFDNYIGNYIIISEETFLEEGGSPEYNTVLFNHKDGTDPLAVGAKISGTEKTLSVTVNEDTKDRTQNMLTNMNYIILIVIVFAGTLAFVVLYNLTNINITERVREIATLKVLGFTKRECCKYVFRENNILTVAGAIVGIPLGILLHAYCMDQINIDMITFETKINWYSFIISFVVTVFFALFVNLFMRRKISAIDMAGSLKSIE